MMAVVFLAVVITRVPYLAEAGDPVLPMPGAIMAERVETVALPAVKIVVVQGAEEAQEGGRGPREAAVVPVSIAGMIVITLTEMVDREEEGMLLPWLTFQVASMVATHPIQNLLVRLTIAPAMRVFRAAMVEQGEAVAGVVQVPGKKMAVLFASVMTIPAMVAVAVARVAVAARVAVVVMAVAARSPFTACLHHRAPSAAFI
jgi:hypothetical protein